MGRGKGSGCALRTDRQGGQPKKGKAAQKGEPAEEKVENEEKEASAVFCPWLPLLLLSANQLDSVCAVDRPLVLLVLLPFCFCFPSSFNPLHIAWFLHCSPSTFLHIQIKNNCLGLSVICDAFRSVCSASYYLYISLLRTPTCVASTATSARCRFRISGDPLPSELERSCTPFQTLLSSDAARLSLLRSNPI